MARTHDDSWDLASSVGATATMIAAGRAMATKTEHPLINDPFADPLVRAAGLDFFVKMIDGLIDFSTVEDASPARMQAIINGARCAPSTLTITCWRLWTRVCVKW